MTIVTPIDHCPVCQYSLNGLPTHGRCPECGFEYDEQTRVWMADRSWRRFAVRYLFLAAALVVLAPMAISWALDIVAMARGEKVAMRPVLFVALFACGLVWAVWYERKCIRLGQFVTTNASGIHWRESDVACCVPWADVAQVRSGLFQVTIRTRSHRMRMIGRFLNRKARAQLYDEIASRIAGRVGPT